MMSSVLMPTARVPTKKAATKPSAPMFTGHTVAAMNITTSASIGISSVDIGISGSCAGGGRAMIRAGQRKLERGSN